MSFTLLLEYCIDLGFKCQDINNVELIDLEEFLNLLDMHILRDDNSPA